MEGQRRRTPARAARQFLAGCVALALGACTAGRSEIQIVGSSTVFPFTTAVVENFVRTHPEFRPPIVESTGTGGGIRLFCGGVGSRFPDAVNASRRIKPSEVAECHANGVREIVEVLIGMDGLVLVQNRTAPPLDLTVRQVYLAFAARPFGRPQTARLWSDVDPALPAMPIEMLGPPPTSGTRDSFNELYMEAGCLTEPAMVELMATSPSEARDVCQRVREDGPFIDAGENDNLIVQRVAQSPHVLGAFGFSYYEANQDRLRSVTIAGVPASYETIAEGTYPAARAIFFYVKGEHVRAIRGLRELLAEFTSDRAWGRRGYLARRGLVASPQPVRDEVAERVRRLVPLDPADLDS